MKYVTFGGTGLRVSRLAFGAMNFGAANYRGFVSDVDEPRADRLVSLALDAGINLFDTANIYAEGQSEELLGRVLRRDRRRDGVLVATKVGHSVGNGPNDQGLSYAHVVQSCEASLRRLGTDWIDLYQAHTVDWEPRLEDTLQALDDLVRRGLVRYVGWSNWPAWRAAQALTLQEARGWARFDCAQIYYSLVGRDAEHEVLPYARWSGLGTLVWSPLAGGFLTGKYTRDDPGGGGGRLASFDFPPIDREHGYDVVAVLKEVAEEQQRTPAQIAIAWLLRRPGVSAVLVGAKQEKQFESNIGALEVGLSEDQLERLEAVSAISTPYPYERAQPPK